MARLINLLFLLLLLIAGGCGPSLELFSHESNALSVYDSYSSAMIQILPLTGLEVSGQQQQSAKIRLYISLLDVFDSQIKGPCLFRFELYEHIQRSGEPKGERLAVWPDFDLTDTQKNNRYWRDFLRAYEFELEFEQLANKDYILQATCFCPNGKRLLAEQLLENPQ